GTSRRRFPYLDPAVVQTRYRAGDGWLDPRRLTLGLARAGGARIVPNIAVTRIEVEDGRVRGIETSRGRLATPAVVIAAGPFSAWLARSAGRALPILLVRRQRLVVHDVPEVPREAPMTIDDSSG